MYEVTLLLSVAIFAAVVVVYMRSGLASIYHPLTLYLAFHGLIFVFRPIIVDINSYDFIYWVYQFRPSLSDKITVLLASSLGLISFAYFAMRSGNVPMQFKDDAAHHVERTMVRKAVPIMLALCVPLGTYAVYNSINVGITGESTMVMKDNIRVNTTDIGYLSDSMLMLVPVCALVAWYWRFSLLALVPLAIFFVMKAASGGRGPFVVAAFAAAFLYFYDRKIKLPSGRILLIAAAVGMFFSFVGNDRGYALREMLGMSNKTESYASNQLAPLEGMDFANLEYFEFVVYVVPQRSDTYGYFVSNLQLLTEPIPRVLWPGKPAGAPIKMINWFEYGRPLGMTTSLPGTGWIELGWVGVFLWCGLWGWATGRFYRWFVSGPQDAFSVSLYFVMYPLLIIGFRDGALLTIVRQGVFLVAPVMIILIVKNLFRIPSLDVLRLMLLRRSAPAAAKADNQAMLPRSVRRRLAEGRLAPGQLPEGRPAT